MMSDEHYLDPPRVLDESREEGGVSAREVFTTRIGETLVLPPKDGWRSFGEDVRATDKGSRVVEVSTEGEVEGEGVLVARD